MKNLYISIIITFFLIPLCDARWYGTFVESKTIGDGVTNCSRDGDYTGGQYNHGSGRYFDSIAYNRNSSTMRCRRWDASIPQSMSLSVPNGWVRTDQSISAAARDRGGSRLKRILIQQRVNGGSWSNFGNWDNLGGGNNTLISRNQTRTVSGQNGNSFQYRLLAYDYAGNSRTISSSNTLRVDTQRPTTSITYRNADNSVYTPGTWTNQSVTVRITCADALSGCNMINKSGWSRSGNTYTRTFTSNTSGVNGSLFVQDNAGNLSTTRSYGTIKIDKTRPTTSITYRNADNSAYTPGTWTNQSVTVNITCADALSGCNMINKSGWSRSGTTYSRTYTTNTSGVSGSLFVQDNAGNLSTTRSYGPIRIDKTVPTIADVTNNNSSNLLANNNYSYEIGISNNGGSPIVLVDYRPENVSNQSLSNPADDTSAPWQFDWNMSLVDNYKNSNGSRTYTYSLRRICDEAGNCWTGTQNYNHAVYANTLTPNISSSIIGNDLLNEILADGTQKDIEVFLRDSYGNAITPASGIGRNIDFNILATNNLHLDQYRNSGNDSALFVGNETTPMSIGGSSSVNLNNRNDKSGDDGEYVIPFYVYAPTSNLDNRVLGSASITGISFDIDATTQIETGDRPQNIGVSGYTNTPIRSNKLYYTIISGGLAQQGFLEGAVQDLDIIVNSQGVTTSNNSLRAEFGDVDASDNNTINDRYRFTINSTEIVEGPQSSWTNTTQINNSLSDFNNGETFMTQDTSVNSETFSYLATIVKHDVRTGSARKTVVYPSDVYGKDSYIGPAGENNSYQEGAKILGNTSSQNTQELTQNQFSSDIRIIGEVVKSTLRRDISRSIFEITKNIPDSDLSNGLGNVTNLSNASNWNVSGNDGTRIFGNQVLFFRGQDVEISADAVQGNKTLLVEDGDIYINGNITGDGMLGIVALNGNILIDHEVTDIHAIIYTDKSVVSTDNGTNILDGDDTAELLANQLYIKGSLFSENTIGGSRKSDPECPYNVTRVCDTQAQAQAYDLNYLRRYFIYDSDDDGSPDTASGQKSFGNTASRGSRSEIESYPVIIEYNPAIQITPPPFFD